MESRLLFQFNYRQQYGSVNPAGIIAPTIVAMFVSTIIIRGNIRNSEEKNSPNAAAAALELIPNNKLTETRPVKFSITFLERNMQIQYEISMDLGIFLDEEYCREIKEERLNVNGEDILLEVQI